jgi:hypothetical protein
MIFQVLFPLISPVMDLLLISKRLGRYSLVYWRSWLIVSLGTEAINRRQHPGDFSPDALHRVLSFYALFVAVDHLAAVLAIDLERNEKSSLLIVLFWHRFFYLAWCITWSSRVPRIPFGTSWRAGATRSERPRKRPDRPNERIKALVQLSRWGRCYHIYFNRQKIQRVKNAGNWQDMLTLLESIWTFWKSTNAGKPAVGRKKHSINHLSFDFPDMWAYSVGTISCFQSRWSVLEMCVVWWQRHAWPRNGGIEAVNIDLLSRSVEFMAAIASILVALAIIIAAMKAGILRRVRFGRFEFEASEKERQQAKALVAAVATPDREPVPFETEQLAQYYAQVLAQSKISFWFSLLFASLGFAVIVIAGFRYSSASGGAAVAQFIAGIIMDAVAAMFFVQSKNAQTAMGDFFDKLRRDRQQVESRRLCENIASPAARDALRVQLSLHYADVINREQIAGIIINACLAGHANPSAQEHNQGINADQHHAWQSSTWSQVHWRAVLVAYPKR